VAKISMFAYHRESGQPVWQSGLATRDSSSNDVWLFGAGPFQYGTVVQHQQGVHVVRGDRIDAKVADAEAKTAKVRIADRAVFQRPDQLVKETRRLPAADEVAHDGAAAGTSVAASTAPLPAARAPVASMQSVAANAPRPGEMEAAAARKIVPRLTGAITGAELLKSASPKTAEMVLPPRDDGSIALPQPRFDSM
jgi:hypothetical protein